MTKHIKVNGTLYEAVGDDDWDVVTVKDRAGEKIEIAWIDDELVVPSRSTGNRPPRYLIEIGVPEDPWKYLGYSVTVDEKSLQRAIRDLKAICKDFDPDLDPTWERSYDGRKLRTDFCRHIKSSFDGDRY